MNENLRQCNIVGGVFYKNDLIKGKRGYESFVGQYLNVDLRKTTMEEKKKRNFWLMVFPYILLVIGIVFYVIATLVSSNSQGEALAMLAMVGLVFTNAAGIIFFISAIFFMKDKGLSSYVGDPEAVLRETKGTIDFDSGKIYSTTKDYQVYSGNQWVTIIGNIIKFIFCLFLMVLFGWLVYIIYRIRMKQVIKKYDEFEAKRQQYSEVQLTSMLICTSEKGLVEGCNIFWQDGKYLTDKVNFVGTFYYKNVIYGAFELEEDDTPVIVELEEGFNHYIIEDQEKTQRLIDIYNSLVES